MTIYKRIGSFILSLLLVFSMFGSTFAIQTFAATSPALSAESKTVNAGEQFTVAVSLANATTVYGGNFTLQYDSSLLTADSYEFSSIVSGHTKNCNLNYQSAGNLIRVTFSGASAVTSSGTLITFTFTAKESVSGSAALQFNAYKMYDENGSAITSTATGSTITIATEPVASPTISVTNKTVTVGETISVPITISNSDAVCGGNFTLQYDSALLTADSYSFGSIVSGHTKNCNLDYQSAGNLIRVTFSGADAVSSDGTLVTFTFTAKASGTATLQFNAYKMYDENRTSISTAVSNGIVEVERQPTRELVSIEISSNPTKTSYKTGESLDTSGLKLKLTYSDNSTETISDGFEVSGYSSTTTGTKTVTVSYQGFVDTFIVVISEPSSNIKSGQCGDNAYYEFDLNTGKVVISGTGEIEWGFDFWPDEEYVKEVIIQDGIVNTGYETFKDCINLTNVIIPSSVTIISENSFENCTSLTNVIIPNGVTSIDQSAFWCCSNLTSVSFSDSIISIDDYAFYKCESLISVNLPNSVTSIGRSAFDDCTNLKSIVIPDSVTTFGDYVLEGCNNIESITSPKCNIKHLFNGNPPSTLKTVVLGSSCESIPDKAFYSCQSLVNITIPDSIKSIGEDAFYNCSNLTNVYITDIASWCNMDYDDNLSNPLAYADYLYLNGELITEVIIPDGVKTIPESAFDCANITSVVIPSSVTSIEAWAFSCTNLKSITISNGIKNISAHAFANSYSLTDIYITDIAAWCNVEFDGEMSNPLYYGENLYLNGELVTDLVIPDEVTTISDYVFNGCKSLTSVTIPNGVTSIGNDSFAYCNNLEVIYGYSGSYAETYANNKNKKFVALDSAKLESISIVVEPNKTVYYIGDSLNTSGLNLKLIYSDDSTETITSGFTTSGFNSTTAGTKTVTVSYQGYTDTFTVTVKTPSITLSADSKTMSVGDTSTITSTTTPSGQTVTWTSSNTSVATVSGGTITAKASGSTTITAKFIYNGTTYSKTCSVIVSEVVPDEPTPTSLSVSSKPTKTTYEIGESLNTSGLKLKLTYSDGSTETITSGFTTSGFSSTTAGTKTVTVKYSGLTTTFTVTVNKNVPVHDACVYTEAKKTVVQGSQFTYTVSLAGTYDGFSFEIASKNGLTVTDIVTTNSNINIDEIGDKWMVSVLGGLAKTDAEKEELVTVTVQVASDAELGARTLTLSNLMLSNESGDKVSAIKYEYASIEITDQIPGDINGDGTFDYYDVSKLYAYYRNKTALSESVDTDVNGDGGFDYYDVSKLYAIYRGKANFN